MAAVADHLTTVVHLSWSAVLHARFLGKKAAFAALDTPARRAEPRACSETAPSQSARPPHRP